MNKIRFNFGWIIVIILSITPIIFWFLTPKINPPFASVQNTIPSLGEIFGLVGITMFSINFILITRLPFIEKLFNGLNNVYKKHNFLGQLAFILLLFHPLFLIPRYASNFEKGASFLLLSSLWARNFGIIALWMMIFLIVLTLYLRPKYNFWKITHKFFGLALFLGALHAYLIPGYIMENLALKSYILIFATFGILAFFYKSIFGKYLIKSYEYIVNSVNHLSEDIIEISLKAIDYKLQFNPGQFIFVSFSQKSLSESHPFSIASGLNENLLKIIVKKNGDYTNSLANKLQKGTIVKIEGPYGVFSYKRVNNKKQIWIAGGVGISPFISFAENLRENKSQDASIMLFYCVKNEKEAVYLKVFKEIESTSNNFSIIPFYSDRNGHINAEYIKKYIYNIEENDFFICAPPRMIKELRNDLLDKGISKDQIHSEEFNF